MLLRACTGKTTNCNKLDDRRHRPLQNQLTYISKTARAKISSLTGEVDAELQISSTYDVTENFRWASIRHFIKCTDIRISSKLLDGLDNHTILQDFWYYMIVIKFITSG